MSLCPAPKALTSNNQVLLLNQHLTPKLNIVLFFLPGTPSFHYLFLFIILIFFCWEFSFFEKVIYEYNMYLYHFPFSLLPQTSYVHPLTLLLLSSLIIINIYNNTMSFSIAQGHMCLSDHPGSNSLSRVLVLGKDWFFPLSVPINCLEYLILGWDPMLSPPFTLACHLVITEQVLFRQLYCWDFSGAASLSHIEVTSYLTADVRCLWLCSLSTPSSVMFSGRMHSSCVVNGLIQASTSLSAVLCSLTSLEFL